MQFTGVPQVVAPLATGHPLGLPGAPVRTAEETKVQPVKEQSTTDTDQGGDRGTDGQPPASFWRSLTGLPDPANHVAPPSIMQIRISALLEEQAEALLRDLRSKAAAEFAPSEAAEESAMPPSGDTAASPPLPGQTAQQPRTGVVPPEAAAPSERVAAQTAAAQPVAAQPAPTQSVTGQTNSGQINPGQINPGQTAPRAAAPRPSPIAGPVSPQPSYAGPGTPTPPTTSGRRGQAPEGPAVTTTATGGAEGQSDTPAPSVPLIGQGPGLRSPDRPSGRAQAALEGTERAASDRAERGYGTDSPLPTRPARNDSAA